MTTCLVVDDEKNIQNLLRKFLSGSGFNVITASSGEEALAIIDRELIDLMILDKKMPGIGGSGVVAGLRERKSRFPFIFLSGSLVIDDELLTDDPNINCCAVMAKPVDLNNLLEAIDRALSR